MTPSRTKPVAYVVDDEPAMLDIVTSALQTQGFETRPFHRAETAWHALERTQPDLVVLDIMLPGISGITLCERIMERWAIPVLLVTAKGEVADRIAGPEAKADDYLAKPFHPRELALGAERLVRRSDGPDAPATRAGGFELDAAAHVAIVGRERVPLTVNEFKLLAAMMARPNTPLSFSDLGVLGLGEVEPLGQRELIKAAIYRMRRKLDAAVPGSSAAIESVRGTGYLLRSVDDDGQTDSDSR